MSKKQKLELTWIHLRQGYGGQVGKEEQAVLEPRILIEDPEKSYGDPHSENMLIHGDKRSIRLRNYLFNGTNKNLNRSGDLVGCKQQTCQASTCKPKCGGSFFALEAWA